MRNHGTLEDTIEALSWMYAARRALKRELHDKGVNEASVNDIVRLVESGNLEAPPEPTSDKTVRGSPNRNVFRNAPQYVNTNKYTPSILPESKGRKVAIFSYRPEYDEDSQEEGSWWSDSDW